MAKWYIYRDPEIVCVYSKKVCVYCTSQCCVNVVPISTNDSWASVPMGKYR